MVVRERVAEVDRREFITRFEVSLIVDLPAVLTADQIIGVRKIMTTAKLENDIVVGFLTEDLMGV